MDALTLPLSNQLLVLTAPHAAVKLMLELAARLGERPPGPRPLLVIDLLATFYDESVNLNESRRLLAGCIPHLQRLSQIAPGVVRAKPPAPISPERVVLAEDLRHAAAGARQL